MGFHTSFTLVEKDLSCNFIGGESTTHCFVAESIELGNPRNNFHIEGFTVIALLFFEMRKVRRLFCKCHSVRLKWGGRRDLQLPFQNFIFLYCG